MLAINGQTELCFKIVGQTFLWKVLVAPIVDDRLLSMDFHCAHQFHLSVGNDSRLRRFPIALGWKGRLMPAGQAFLARREMAPANSECVVKVGYY